MHTVFGHSGAVKDKRTGLGELHKAINCVNKNVSFVYANKMIRAGGKKKLS